MRPRTHSFLAVLLAVATFLFFYRLGEHDLWASHEARAAQNAQRILDDGDWLLPRLFDDQVELQKPPLYYWLVAVAGWCRGSVDSAAVRLPSAAAGLATVLVVFGFLASRGRPVAGLFAAMLLATAQHFTSTARTGRIDVPLTLTTTASILCLWHGDDNAPRFGRCLCGYAAMATGMLLKGPIGVLLPLAVLCIDAVISGRAGFFRTLRWGLPVVVAVAGPWFAVAHLRTGGQFTQTFFWYHHVERATGGAAAMATHPWWYYGPRLAIDFLPWSPFLLVAGWARLRSESDVGDCVARLSVIWLTTIVLVLSASKFKRADYLLPAYPGAALWLGCVGERVWERTSLRRLTAAAASFAVAGIVAAWAAYLNLAVPKLDGRLEKHTIAAVVRAAAPQPELLLLFRVEEHLLAYHLGRPLNTFLEWENLDVWAGRPDPHHVLMPAECASAWRQYITSGTLVEVLRYTDRSDRRRPRDLVLMRTRPDQGTILADGPADRPTAGEQRADQRANAGLQPGGRAGVHR